MEELIDGEFENRMPEEDGTLRRRGLSSLLAKGAAASIVLHLLLSTILFLPGGYSPPGGTVTFVDITSPADPAPSAEEPREEAADAADMPEPVQVSEPSAAEVLPAVPPTPSESLAKEVDSAVTRAGSQPEALHEASLALGLSAGFFNSLNEGRTLRGDIREYYFNMLRRVNESWWMLGGGKGLQPRRDTQLFIVVSAEGKILDRKVAISSGDPLYDRKVMQAVELAGPLPPLPPDYPMPVFEVPLKVVKPLSLFNLGES